MPIPAMTSDAERAVFRRLACKCAPHGAIIELGAWLGAGTVAIAEGIKESGARNVVHSYDRFKWNTRTHPAKAGGRNITNLFAEYKKNLGGLSDYVVPHVCEIESADWDGTPISLLVSDGPKRWDPVKYVLRVFGSWVIPGGVTAWQDFCFPPAYAIPACLYRLRESLEYSEAVDYTVVFDVRKPLEQISSAPWSAAEVIDSLNFWHVCLPERCYAKVVCGAAMLLNDLGQAQRGRLLLSQADRRPLEDLKKTHSALMNRYAELFR